MDSREHRIQFKPLHWAIRILRSLQGRLLSAPPRAKRICLIACATLALLITWSRESSLQVTIWQADQNFVNAVVNSFGACPAGFVITATQIGIPPRCVAVNPGGIAVSSLASAATVTMTSDGTTSIQDEYLVLANNVATINTPAASTMPDGKIIHLIIEQPAGNFMYTSPTCFVAGASTQVKISNNVSGGTPGACGGTGVVPTIGATTYAMLEFAFEYHVSVAAGDVATLVVLSGASTP